MTIKPWLSAIVKPTVGGYFEHNKSPPEGRYDIEFVHGFKSNIAWQNCLYNLKG